MSITQNRLCILNRNSGTLHRTKHLCNLLSNHSIIDTIKASQEICYCITEYQHKNPVSSDWRRCKGRKSSEKSLEYPSLSLQVEDLCSQFLCICQMWKHFHDCIHLTRVEDGLQFLSEIQPLWIKCSRGWLLLAPGMVLMARVVGVWGTDRRGETTWCPGLGQPLKGIWPVFLLMVWGFTVMEAAGEAVLMWHARREHVRRVRVVFGLTLGVQVSVMLLMSCWGHYMGTAHAGLAAVIFLYTHWGVSGSTEGTLLLGPEPVGKVRVLALIRSKARIQVLVRDVGIVMIRHRVLPRPLFLTLTACCWTGHVILTFSRILPVGTGIMSRPLVRLKLPGW